MKPSDGCFVGWRSSSAASPSKRPRRCARHQAITDAQQVGEPFTRNKLALGIASALYPYWTVNGYHREGRAWLDRGLARTDPTEGTSMRAKALLVAATLAAHQGDREASETLV